MVLPFGGCHLAVAALASSVGESSITLGLPCRSITSATTFWSSRRCAAWSATCWPKPAKNKGMPGEHHFFITFDTTAEDVRLSDRLRAQYPEEMTIVLQHQFWDLKVTDEAFEVGLSFGGVAERLVVPFEAIKAFADPSVQFTLQFETLAEAPDERRRRRGGRDGNAAESQAADAGNQCSAEPASGGRRIRRIARAAARKAGRQGWRRSGAARPLPQEVMASGSDHEAHQDSHPDRDRHLRPHRGAGRPLLGRADPALDRELPHRHRAHAAAR